MKQYAGYIEEPHQQTIAEQRIDEHTRIKDIPELLTLGNVAFAVVCIALGVALVFYAKHRGWLR